MKKRLLSVWLAVVMMLLLVQPALAAPVQFFSAADLPDPIPERLLEGDNEFPPPFDFLNGRVSANGDKYENVLTISANVAALLIWNSKTDLDDSAQPDFPVPNEDTQDKELLSYASLGEVVKVEFVTGVPGVTVDPAFKWLVVDATYGRLPTPKIEDASGSLKDAPGFLGWFNSDGAEVTAKSIVIGSNEHEERDNNLYARFSEGALSPQTTPDADFADVQKTSKFYDAIHWAVRTRITKGITENQFGPAEQCTRKQILTFLWRLAAQPKDEAMNDFDAAVNWAYENGILSGNHADFNREAPCRRAEVMEYLWRLCGSPAQDRSAGNRFTDVAADASFAPAVAWAVQTGITDGTSANTFSPDSTCTRGQIVTFLYRACTAGLLSVGTAPQA